MKNVLNIIIIISLLWSCNATRSYVILSEMDRYEIFNIALDSSYKLYIREVFQAEDDSGEYYVSQDLRQSDQKKVIEVEYLLISKAMNNVIYIATRPDKYQNYYAEHNLHAEGKLNAYDFFMFHFGKIISDTLFEFRTEENPVIIQWLTKLNDDSLTLRKICQYDGKGGEETYNSIDIFNAPVTFRIKSNFEIALVNWNVTTEILNLKKDILYIGGQQGRYKLYLKFSKSVPKKFFNPRKKKLDENNTIIKFKDKHLKYNPKLLVN